MDEKKTPVRPNCQISTNSNSKSSLQKKSVAIKLIWPSEGGII